MTSLTSVRLLTPGQVAAIFQVEPQTVSRWNRTGRLAAVRTPGGHRRFSEDDVLTLLENVLAVEDTTGTAPDGCLPPIATTAQRKRGPGAGTPRPPDRNSPSPKECR